MIPKQLEMLIGQVRLRGDDGPTGRLDKSEMFLRIDGQIYPLSRLVTGPPVLASQLVTRREYSLEGELLELTMAAACEPKETG